MRDGSSKALNAARPPTALPAFLLALNQQVAACEAKGEPVTAPGLPPCVGDAAPFITEDCVRPPELGK